MSSLDYYKSLITDEEVVKALVKESKAREGRVKKVRIKPNIKFLRRTVYNIMSANERLSVNQQKIIEKEKQKTLNSKAKAIPVRRKNFKELIRDILSEKTHYISDTNDVTYVSTYKQESSSNRTLPAASSLDATDIIVLDDSDDSLSDGSVIVLSDTEDESSNKISCKLKQKKRS